MRYLTLLFLMMLMVVTEVNAKTVNVELNLTMSNLPTGLGPFQIKDLEILNEDGKVISTNTASGRLTQKDSKSTEFQGNFTSAVEDGIPLQTPVHFRFKVMWDRYQWYNLTKSPHTYPLDDTMNVSIKIFK